MFSGTLFKQSVRHLPALWFGMAAVACDGASRSSELGHQGSLLRLFDDQPPEAAAANISLLKQRGRLVAEASALWDLSGQRRTHEELHQVTSDGAVELAPKAALVRILRCDVQHRLRLNVLAEGPGANLKVVALKGMPADARRSTRPRIWQRHVVRELAHEPLVGGEGGTTCRFAQAGGADHLLISLQSRNEPLILQQMSLEAEVQSRIQRFRVGEQTRRAMLLRAGETVEFELPAQVRGRLNWSAGIPDEARRFLQPVTLAVAGNDGTRSSQSWREEAAGTPLRRFEERSLDFEPVPVSHSVRFEVSGPPGAVVVLGEPTWTPLQRAPAWSVILISVDTLRADFVGRKSKGGTASPHLDRLSASAVCFQSAYSTSNYTLPSHASLMTGMAPIVHGAEASKTAKSIRALPTLVKRFRERGYRTAAFTGGGYVDADFGFDEAFDQYGMLDPYRSPDNPRYETHPRREDPGYNARLYQTVGPESVTAWIQQHAVEPFFLFLHTYRVHEYLPSQKALESCYGKTATRLSYDQVLQMRGDQQDISAESLKSLKQAYLATVFDVDHYVSEVFAALEHCDLLDRTLVVLTADHGEAFGDHDLMFHAQGLYEELLRVPLLFWVPGQDHRQVPQRVSLMDVAPTILDLLRFEPLPAAQGRSLRPAILGRRVEPRPLVAQDYKSREERQRAWIFDRFKLIYAVDDKQDCKLFDLDKDPAESVNLAGQEPDSLNRARSQSSRIFKRLREIRTTVAAELPQSEIRESTQAGLEQLGYVDH